jgi:hypothetical protein
MRMPSRRHRQRGVGLLVVMMILGLVGAYFAMQFFAVGNQRAESAITTTTALAQATDALIGFAASVTPPYLPCPDRTAGAGANDGVEDRAGPACVVAEGNLPWLTLGIAGKDAWGNRLRYRVTPAFIDQATGIALTSVGTLTVNDGNGNALALAVPVVILSHGQNTWGATSGGGAVIALPPVANVNERENTDGDALFVSAPRADQGAAGGEFDDQITWLTTAQVTGRLQAAGKL